ILLVSANTTCGVTGKMISPQFLSIACAAFFLAGNEMSLLLFFPPLSLLFPFLVFFLLPLPSSFFPFLLPFSFFLPSFSPPFLSPFFSFLLFFPPLPLPPLLPPPSSPPLL
ncbi:hypothetical protein FG392_28885, partial [Klebsiella pneumoniae]